MSVLAQFVVVAKTLVQHGVALALRHVFELAGLEIAQTDVFHQFLLVSCYSRSRSLSFCYQIVVRETENRQLPRRAPTGDDGLAPPRQSLVQVRGFQYPKAAYVLLGLQVRPVGDKHLAIGLRPQG